MNYYLQFHHLGLAVKSPDKSVKFLSNLEYTISQSVTDEIQNVNLIFCQHKHMPNIEIIYPTDTEGPLSGMLKTNTEMIYHICYESVDIAQSLTAIKNDGHRIICISPPKPAILFFGKTVSFYKISGFGIVEMIAKD